MSYSESNPEDLPAGSNQAIPAAGWRHSSFSWVPREARSQRRLVAEQGLGYQEGSGTSLTGGQQPVPAAFQPALLWGEWKRGLQS